MSVIEENQKHVDAESMLAKSPTEDTLLIPSPPKFPTISVLLPTLNDGFRLGVQLQAILPQLTVDDELILLLDGSDELTRQVATSFEHPCIKLHSNETESGVCQAYNQCAKLAEKDWILGAAGNDELQEGAIDAWREAAMVWPDARVMHGQISRENVEGWTHQTSFITPAEMPAIWKAKGWRTHGAATFIRRDSWGRGYVPEHHWFADAFQALTLCLKWGCVDLHKYISKVNFEKGSFSWQEKDTAKHNECIRGMRNTFAEPEYEGIREIGMAFHENIGWLSERMDGPVTMMLDDAARLGRLMAKKRNDRLEGLLDMVCWLRKNHAKIDTLVMVGGTDGPASGELFALHYRQVLTFAPWVAASGFSQEFDLVRADHPGWTAMPMPSEQAAIMIPDGAADMVYLDCADECLAGEIARWLPKIKQGGYLAGSNSGMADYHLKTAELGEPEAVFLDSSWVLAVNKERSRE